MQVNPCDGRCRECGSRLQIIDVDDATITVACPEGHSYQVEPDAFGDGCLVYYLELLADKQFRTEND